MAADPLFVLLDEPAAGLSLGEAESLKAAVRTMARAGLGVLIVEHNLPVVFDIADVVTVLDEGRVISRGTPHGVSRDPEVIRVYIGGATPTAPALGRHAPRLRRHDARLPKKGASPKLKIPPSLPTSQYPWLSAVVAMPVTGATSGRPPIEPWNAASPKLKIPPSDATNRYPLPSGPGAHAHHGLVETEAAGRTEECAHRRQRRRRRRPLPNSRRSRCRPRGRRPAG